MKVINLYTANNFNPRILGIFRYLQDHGFRIIIRNIEKLFPLPSPPSIQGVFLKDDITALQFGKYISVDYFNRNIKDKPLRVINRKFYWMEVADIAGVHWIVYNNWIKQ